MGLEVVVRPRVIPDFRPRDVRDARSGNLQQGLFQISGGGGQFVELRYTFHASTQKQYSSEEYRVFDIIRIYKVKTDKKDAEGNEVPINYKVPLQPGESIDKKIFTDQEVMWQIIHVKHNGEIVRTTYKKPNPEDWIKGNMRVIEEDIVRKTKGPKRLHELILPGGSTLA